MGGGVDVTWVIALATAFLISIMIARFNANQAASERAGRTQAQNEARQKDNQLAEIRHAHTEQLAAFKLQYKRLLDHTRGMGKIFEERKIQFPWLATAIADFHALEAETDAEALQTKRHPAMRAAAQVREHGNKRREAERAARRLQYRVEYYEKLFPWLTQYIGDDVPDAAVEANGSADASDDPVKLWLTEAEYEMLSTIEKNQIALDRWKRKKRSNWEIAREYERFIGYNYESLGYDVTYTGAILGFEDMGRDVIARRGPELRLIQCKYWSQDKTIHEKHIFQLFGVTLEYAFRLGAFEDLAQLSLFGGLTKNTGTTAVLYTSAKISDVAKEVARRLGVECNENVGISDYPLIKCNVSSRDGAKIYHLPFDQQYDRTKIKADRSEKYVYTVAEAEVAGFRRVWQWRPDGGANYWPPDRLSEAIQSAERN